MITFFDTPPHVPKDKTERKERRKLAKKAARGGSSRGVCALKFVAGFTAIGLGFGAVGLMVSSPFAAGAVTAGNKWTELPATLPPITMPARSVIVASDGTRIADTWTINRVPIPGDKMAPTLREAVVAVEDSRFYQHGGVDLVGLVRAGSSTASGGSVQGGSTITQQYVKNMLIADAVIRGGGVAKPEELKAASGRNLDRKLREMKLALNTDRTMSKEDILTGYLNAAYFGADAYGAQAASQRFFSVNANQLNLAQSALLAGLVQSPTAYDPRNHPKAATERRNHVLDRMAVTGKISPQVAKLTKKAPLNLRVSPITKGCAAARVGYGFVCDQAMKELANADWLGGSKNVAKLLTEGGYTITTTVDVKVQDAAIAAAQNIIPPTDRVANAVVTVQPGTGNILVSATNRNYGTGEGATEVALPTISSFSPGSTFKLFTLLTAIESGINVETILPAGYEYYSEIFDNPDGGYHNAEGLEGDNVSIRLATEHSLNTAYVQLEERLGTAAVANTARRLGVMSIGAPGTPEGPGVKEGTFALGVRDVSVTEMAGAYAAIANGGTWCAPHIIEKVKSSENETTYNPAPKQCRAVTTTAAASTVTDVLAGVATNGTAKPAQLPDGRPIAAKTGTADNVSAAWLAGYTPQAATVVWTGDPVSPLNGLYDVMGLPKVYGGTLPADLWRETMWAYLQDKPALPLPGLDPNYLLGVGAAPTDVRTVPDVAGMDPKVAQAKLATSGYRTATVQAPGPGSAPAGRVWKTNPKAGTAVPEHGVVTIVVTPAQ